MTALLPDDELNRALVAHVHPSDWQNPSPSGPYNLVVIGGGTAGLVTALGAAGLGATVALIERHLLGGDCLNYGCVPSKALIRAASAAHAVRVASEFGVTSQEPVVSFSDVMRHVRSARAQIAPHDAAARIRQAGVDLYFGDAAFEAESRLRVGESRLEFRRAVIATGSRPNLVSIPGLEEAGYLTNESVFSLEELPRRLAVIGGGPIGCELAQSFARLGSAVTLFEAGASLLPRDHPDAAGLVTASLRRDGIAVRLNANIDRVALAPDGVAVHLGQGEPVMVDRVLVATGRRANLEGLGLDAAGVDLDERGLVVDDHLRTTNRRIFAAGDVASRYQFTHAADAMARLVIQNALFYGRRRVSQLDIPWCTYTDPEVAHIGLTHAEAQRRGLPSVRAELADNDRAIVERNTEGFALVHYSGRRGNLRSATVVGPHAGELIATLSLAMTHGIDLGQLASVIVPYPTHTEILKRLGDQFQRTKLSPGLEVWLRRLFRWRR